MQNVGRKKKAIKAVLALAALLAILFISLLIFASRYVPPMLRSRLHTLIIQGSDSLYRYELGKLDADFFGGNVAVENLHIRVDSNRYRQLQAANALPSLTMQLDLQRGYIKGLSIVSLLFGKKINVDEIGSREANIRLSRHLRPQNVESNTIPLWKTLQPAIKSIRIGSINLDGVKLLYRNADTSESLKLQFDRCEAQFDDVRIDSVAAADTARIAFTKNIKLRFSDLKFRTPDSAYKMKAETIVYSSKERYLELTDFKLQPTIEDKKLFYASAYRASSMYEITFAKAAFTGLRLDRFINDNIIIADSIVVQKPELFIYSDKTLFTDYVNKYGTYPHQKLLRAAMAIDVRGIRMRDATIKYTERGAKSGTEGTLDFKNTQLLVSNITNLPLRIKENPVCVAQMQTRLFESSPLEARFRFYLDSVEGEFAVDGKAKNISAAQLNKVAIPLGNTELKTGIIHNIDFALTGDEYTGYGQVDMRYDNLSLILRKRNDEGIMTTKKFLTKLLNRFTLHPGNPGPDGVERKGARVYYARPSSKSFFATVWKTLFAGMQNVMLKSGVYE